MERNCDICGKHVEQPLRGRRRKRCKECVKEYTRRWKAKRKPAPGTMQLRTCSKCERLFRAAIKSGPRITRCGPCRKEHERDRWRDQKRAETRRDPEGARRMWREKKRQQRATFAARGKELGIA